MHKHLPDDRVAPVVGNWLWNDLNEKVVVPAFEVAWRGVINIPVDANHVLAQTFEGVVEGMLVVDSFAFSERDDAFLVASPDQNTPVVDSVKSSNIGHTV